MARKNIGPPTFRLVRTILVFNETNIPGLDVDGHSGVCLRSEEQQTPLAPANSLQSE